MRIAIVGGGLGGLAAALFLSKAGLDATVYEQAADLREVGAGIVVSPNMVRPLRKLEGPPYKRQAPSVERAAAAPMTTTIPAAQTRAPLVTTKAEESKKFDPDDLEVPSFLRRR